MIAFKVGDKVVCVRPKGNLILNHVYDVCAFRKSGLDNFIKVKIPNKYIYGGYEESGEFFTDRFILFNSRELI